MAEVDWTQIILALAGVATAFFGGKWRAKDQIHKDPRNDFDKHVHK